MKEHYEWLQTWSDEAERTDLPRVLLVGDSIAFGYQSIVREALRGVCLVDHFCTSYAADTAFYHAALRMFVTDARYAAVHFNHGLHGKHMTCEVYKENVDRLLEQISGCGAKVIAALTTQVLGSDGKPDAGWEEKVAERNAAIEEIAVRRGYAVNDLYAASVSMPSEKRSPDGVHFEGEGYRVFADKVAAVIRQVLGK